MAEKKGCTINLHKDRIDTSTAARKLFYTVMVGMAKFERRHASRPVWNVPSGTGRYLDDPVTVVSDTVERIRELKAQGKTVREIAATAGGGVGTVARAVKSSANSQQNVE